MGAPNYKVIGQNNNDIGHVRIFDYNGSAWVQVGADIVGEAAGDRSGHSVALSSDGSRVAIGAIFNDGTSGNTNDVRGHVRVYSWNGSAWTKLGQDIDGEAAGDQSGNQVAISSDGSRVAIGGSGNDGNGTDSGHVRVYDYNGSAWVQVGADIDGEAAGDFCGSGVSLSSDGSILAVGAVSNDGGGTNSGHVRIYKYTPSGVSSWTQLGADIDDGNASGDSEAVSLSSDGSRIAIGAKNYTSRGTTRIYDYNSESDSWTQFGANIDGEANSDYSGDALSLSPDGSRVAIGARDNDGTSGDTNDRRGHVRVYSLKGETYQYAWDVDSGGAPSDGTYRATVAGADLAGNAYSGTDSITFTLDTTAPTVTLTDTDSDNLVSTSEVVTITAGFSEAMTATPTISITGIVTNVIMTPVSGTNSYTYAWDTSSGTLTTGNYAATVSGTDAIGNAYVAGTQSITFRVDTSTPTVSITTNDPDNTIKPGDNITVTVTFNEPMASGPRITIGSAVNNVALTATNSTTFTYSWSTSGVSAGSYTVTVTGTDLAGNTYAGSDKITITLDSTAPTVTLSDTDDDNLLAASDTVTITASFDEAMTATPTISITGVVNNVAMSLGGVSFNKSNIASYTGHTFRPSAVFAADIDGDGHMDVISNNFNTSTNIKRVYWYKNNGEKDPAFTENLLSSIAADVRSLFAADMDGDGDMDIIVVYPGAFYWFENVNGDGSSWTATDIEPGYGSPNFSSAYVADVDNDGDNDIVVSNRGYGSSGTWDKSGGVGWYENDGEADPSFSRNNIIDYAYGANNVVVADLTGDGKLDIVSTWQGYPNNAGSGNLKKAVYRHINDGNANPSFTTLAIRSGMPNLTSVFAADMDGDGDVDVVTSQQVNPSSLSLFKNNGLGVFTYSNIPTNAGASNFRSVYPGDINGDGHMDFVVLYYSSSGSNVIELFENDGNSNPTWTYSTIATSTNFNMKLFIEDIDGDGDADVLSADYTEPVSWHENGPSYSYTWDVDSGGAPSDGTYRATVAGADLAGNAYSGTDSITLL